MLSSPTFDYPAKRAEELAAGRRSSHVQLVEMYGGDEAFVKTRENARGVAKALAEAGKVDTLPRLFASSGSEDIHRHEFVDTIAYFHSLGIPVEYRETPGYGHEWRFWDQSIQDALAFFGFKTQNK